ncbi:MAG: YggU family protein [Nitrospirae bacterium]|nr:MAG: YggU family protein [Nitrospirota bacterium]
MEQILRETNDGVLLRVTVQPRAARTEYVGLHGDTIKIRVAAPPVDNAANEALCRFLADWFRIPKRAVHLCAGHQGRQKQVKLQGISLHHAKTLLAQLKA